MSDTTLKWVCNGWRTWRPRFAVFAVLLGACASEQSEPSLGSNSNWLTLCDEDTDCGSEIVCRCGACANQCESDADCSELRDSRCAAVGDPVTASACFEAAEVGMCLPRCEPGGCQEQMPCVAGACVPIALPGNDFCEPEANRDAEERTLEDGLLAELAELRAAGGVVCGNNPETPPAPALSVDARLWCAARALAGDMDQSGERTLIDSLGRGTRDRLRLAGYDETRWGETFATSSSSTLALQAMLSSESACQELTAADLVDVGVGVSGDVAVITMASP
jgi:uncharacterized protein YkwD